MRVELTTSGCTLYREPGDKRISHESTVTYHMKLKLNEQGHNFARMYPDREGLTSCRQGLKDKKAGIILWHERYAIEDAAQEFNQYKSIRYMRTDFPANTAANRRLERVIDYLREELNEELPYPRFLGIKDAIKLIEYAQLTR